MVDAIRAAKADVVGLQEPFGRTRLIARMLGPGWYAYPRLHTVSRYPILEPGGAKSVYAYVQIAPGRVVAMLNTHLPSAPYGPYGVRDGKGLARILHNENVAPDPLDEADPGRRPAVDRSRRPHHPHRRFQLTLVA